MNSITYVGDKKKKFIQDVHRLAHLGFYYINSDEDVIIVQNDLELFLVV